MQTTILRRALFPLLCVAFAGCGDDEPPRGTWQKVFDDLPSGLTSVWGTSARDVWVVGSHAVGDDAGPMVLHFDGTGWMRRPTGQTGNLWWVHGFAGGPVFVGGANGMILRYEAGAFTRMDTPGSGTVYGIWGSSASDVWAVGGAGDVGAFAWRSDGSSWSAVEGLPPGIENTSSFFKVWGLSPDDVWIVGSAGVAFHWDGSSFRRDQIGSDETIFTVHADAGRFAAVGGQGGGELYENDGSGWVDRTPQFAPMLFGVALAGERGVAVGFDAQIFRRASGGWVEDDTGIETRHQLHGTWIDPGGGVWAAGGEVLAEPLSMGMLLHFGAPIAAGTFAQ